MHFMHAWNWTYVTFSEGFGHWTFLWRVHPIAQHAEEERWNSQHPTRNETDSRLFQNHIYTDWFNFNQDAVASLFAAHGTASVTRSTWVTSANRIPKSTKAWPQVAEIRRVKVPCRPYLRPCEERQRRPLPKRLRCEWRRPVNPGFQLESWHLQGKSIARGTQKWIVSLQIPIEKWRIWENLALIGQHKWQLQGTLHNPMVTLGGWPTNAAICCLAITISCCPRILSWISPEISHVQMTPPSNPEFIIAFYRRE